MKRAAGILPVAPNGKVLLLRRARNDHPGTWACAGGGIEGEETAEACARREFAEETGHDAVGPVQEWTRRVKDDVDFTTFLHPVEREFDPALNEEHDAWEWVWPKTALEKLHLHPGAKIVLQKFDINELEVARAIRDGELVSPQKHANMLLVDMRITGTGASFRPKFDEFVWRDPHIYLNQDFVDRCNGLQVIWEHPSDGEPMDSKEFAARTVGNIFVPYIKGDEIWGVAKIYDAEAAKLIEDKTLSTSPCVVLASGVKKEMEGGKHLLIEGEPDLIDHLALVEAGVWDKGGPPTGISKPDSVDSPLTGDTTVPNEDKAPSARQPEGTRPDAAAAPTNSKEGADLDRFLTHLDSRLDAKLDAMAGHMKAHMDARMDAFEKKHSDSAKADAKHEDDDDDDDDDDDGKPKQPAADKKHKKKSDAAKADAKSDDDDDDKKHSKSDDDDDDDDKKHHKADAKSDDDDDDSRRRRKSHRSDDDDDDKKHKSDAKSDSATVTSLQQQITDLQRRVPAELTDEVRRVMTAAQSSAERVHQTFGDAAGAPRWLNGESHDEYRRRLLSRWKGYSKTWKDVDLNTLSGGALDIVEKQVYADAVAASSNPGAVPENTLVEITETDRAGRKISRFIGDPEACWGRFKQPVRRVIGVTLPRRD